MLNLYSFEFVSKLSWFIGVGGSVISDYTFKKCILKDISDLNYGLLKNDDMPLGSTKAENFLVI
jgi:hypothetical protein